MRSTSVLRVNSLYFSLSVDMFRPSVHHTSNDDDDVGLVLVGLHRLGWHLERVVAQSPAKLNVCLGTSYCVDLRESLCSASAISENLGPVS